MSTLFEQASLVMIPSGYKEDVVYSVKPTDGSGDLTFTRASDGTRVNSQGLVERVPWNLVQQSNTFSSATWLKQVSGGTTPVLTSGFTDPDGGSNAWRLQCSISGGLYSMMSQALSSEGLNCNSIWIKSNTGSNQNVYFRINNADQTTTRTATNTWQRIEVYTDAVGQSFTIGVRSAATGSSSSCDVLIYAAQTNIGSTAKPYFPTTDRLNVPRLDYSGGCPSLLLEPQRTNVITNSNDFVTGANNVTTTANNATSPEGYQNADLITGNSGTLTKLVDFNGASAGTYTLSVFAKYNTQQWIQLGAGAIATYANFDIQNGVLGNTNGTSQIEDYGNGWYRCSVVMVSGTPLSHYVGIVTNGTAARLATTSSTNSFWAYGIQSEIGSYPTSYIPTTSASVTRVADAASIDPSSVLGATQGSWFMELNDLTFEVSGTSVPTNWLGLDVANCLAIEGRAAGQNKNIYFVKEESNVVTTLTTKVISGTLKACFVWNGTSLKCFVNGVKEYDASGFTQPSSWSTLEFNYSNREAQQLINQTILFPTALSDSEAIALTTL